MCWTLYYTMCIYALLILIESWERGIVPVLERKSLKLTGLGNFA